MASKTYTEYNFTISPPNPGTEILMAQLAQVGFDSFEETNTGVKAYISSEENRKTVLDDIQILKSPEFEISFQTQSIQQKNWNAKWESQFQPIEVDGICQIRASFHTKKEMDFNVVINPKMAFGTGHHATTHLMVQFLLKENLTGKTVLDMGCGTGILAILADMKNAKHIDAIDIDEWSYENTLENADLNNCENISVYEGDAKLLKAKKYNVVFANINRNILLRDIGTYSKGLCENGILFLSGFYEADLPSIQKRCEKFGLRYETHKKRDGWVAVKYVKNLN